MNKKQLGILGEKIAANYLKDKGYQILDKNYSFGLPGSPKKGEVDIIAKKGGVISFIEVKTLTKNEKDSTPLISPEEQVNLQKQRKLIKMAESWLIKKKIPLDSRWQIDAIAIKIDLNSQKAKIRHFQNIT